jgi:renalase
MECRTVAVIGAGIAGLAAAREFTNAGIAVRVFEKSQGLGGRMATRRAGALSFDHGAQYFTARDPEFLALVDRWTAAGLAAPWFDASFIGIPGMSAPSRAMADGLEVAQGHTISGLRRTTTGWHLDALEGPVDQPPAGFDAVVIAVPSPQAMPLLATAGIHLAGIKTATYSPCWALMAAFDAPLSGVPDQLRPAAGPLAWVARNSSKPGRPSDPACYVAHATKDWSVANLELTAQAASEKLLQALMELTSPMLVPPRHAVAHRWRFALVERAVNQPCLWDANARIGACGDWCLGPRVEAAFLSGRSLGRTAVTGLASDA